MTSVLETVAVAMTAGVVAGLVALWRRRRASASRRRSFARGRTVKVPCAARRGEPKWRHGKLVLAHETVTWRPRFGTRGTFVVDHERAVAAGRRPVLGKENWHINPSLVVLAYNTGGTRLELAVLPEDLDTVGRVLEIPGEE